MIKKNNKLLFNELLLILNKNEPIYFFNRLNVPKEFRWNGYGKLLLKKVLEYCATNNYMLINTANEYGEMGQSNLIRFYEKNGMLLADKEGIFIYHNLINKSIENKKTRKIIL
jgi:GNAT superfamily N-acetyltransferase